MKVERTPDPENMFDELIVHISAWRRLRHSFIEMGEKDPEFKDISDEMVELMDLCYRDALDDLRKQKSDMIHQLKKAHDNSNYGRMYQ